MEKLRPSVTLDESVVMPNHIHGILVIDHTTDNGLPKTPRRGVSTQSGSRERAWKPGALEAIVNQFKSVCTKRIRAEGYRGFAWQPRFHDHILRNEQSLTKTREYIHENPSK